MCSSPGTHTGRTLRRCAITESRGTLKCDGRLVSVGAIFQVYAPYLMKESDLNAKVKEDFEGALFHWDGWLKTWIFVHNDARGLPAGVVQYLDLLRSQNPKVKIEVWSEPELLSLLQMMDLAAHQLMFGYAPSLAVVDRLAMQDLVPIIEALSRAEPSVTDPPLTPPSLQKLQRNSLSSDARSFSCRWAEGKATWCARFSLAGHGPISGSTSRRRSGNTTRH